MSGIILGQVRFVLVTLCLGMLLMAGYDILRLLRWLVPHHKMLVGMEDLLYWSAMSLPAFFVFYIYNDGEIRWYGALAVLLGGLLYEKGISGPVRRFGRRYLDKPKKKLFAFFGKGLRNCRMKRREKGEKKKRKKERFFLHYFGK